MLSSSHGLSAPPPVDHKEESCTTYPDWILLDTLPSDATHRWRSLASAKEFSSSATTATALVKLEKDAGAAVHVEVEVSFQLFDPPDVSSFSARCRGLRDDGVPYHACVVGAVNDLLLLYIVLERYKPGFYLVYRAASAGHGSPSLEVLPRPSRSFQFHPTLSVGILPLAAGGEGSGYLVVAYICLRVIEDAFKCELFVYSSKTGAWSTKLAPLLYDFDTDWNAIRNHNTDKVITIGRDSLGWVDLWWGILVCSFLNDEEGPVVSLIELPDPMPGNKDRFGKSSAPSCRDIICIDVDQMRLVEVDYHRSAHGVSLGHAGMDFGWKARSWSRTLSSDDWHDCFEVDTDEFPMTDEVYSCLYPGLRVDEKVDELAIVESADLLRSHPEY